MKFLPEGDPRRAVWEACESPIEQYLCCALFALLGCKAVWGPFDHSRLSQLSELAGTAPACFLFTQHSIGIYRADFLLVTVNPDSRTHRRIVIECDGKEFHGSDEQIARDQSRDDEIENAGYRIIRYPGKAIHGRMPEIAGEIKQWIEAGGIVCEPGADMEHYAGVLSCVTPDRSANQERKEERAAYWNEENADSQTARLGFVMETGELGWWRDTL